MTISDGIAIASLTSSVVMGLWMWRSDRREKRTDRQAQEKANEDSRLNRAEDQITAHSAQLSVLVGGIQRLDARQERIESLLFSAFGAKPNVKPQGPEGS